MTGELGQLRAAVASAADAVADPDRLWATLCGQIGIAALGIPEEHGGAGGGLPELAAAGFELGRRLAGGRLLGTVLAGQLLLALGETSRLPALAAGDESMAVCWAGADGRWSPRHAAVTVTDGTLTGTAHHVLDGVTADVLLVVAHDGDGTVQVYEADEAGVARAATPALDDSRRLARVGFAGTPARRLGSGAGAPEALRRALDTALVVQAAENAGAARRCLELTVGYSKQRVQFGRPIGSFQALKHRMADLHVLVETAESAAFGAAAGVVDAPVAAAYCGPALFAVAAETVQLHGGIAITWEHPAHRYLKRAHAATQLLGSPPAHRAALATRIGM